MNTFFKKGGVGVHRGFASLLLILVVAIAGAVVGYTAFENQGKVEVVTPVNVENKTLGANGTEIPTSIALFETSLASRITNVATSMTLVSATDKAGNTLASSTYAFILDEGKTNEEMVLADCTGTACTNMIRGLSPLTGTTTVSALRFAHNRGASVKITDGPQLLILSRIANGQNDFPNLIRYKNGVTVTSGDSDQTLASKGYVLNTANAGAATSTESRGGLVELGTLAEQASSYDGGSDKPTVLQTKNSTSTCQVVGSYNIVASSTTGKMDKGCFDQTANYTFAGENIFSATTTMATTSISSLVLSGTATTTFQNISVATNASSTNLTISNSCVGCFTRTIATTSMSVYNGGTPSVSEGEVTCPTNYVAVGGGIGIGTLNGSAGGYPTVSYPSATNKWYVRIYGGNGSTADPATLAYAVCVK